MFRDYSHGTANGPLRKHLDTHHKQEYLTEMALQGWPNKLPSFTDLRKKAAENAKAMVTPRVPFSAEGLVIHLVRFIVANDQVSSKYSALLIDK